MMQALLAPVLKSIVLGGIGIGVALGFHHGGDGRVTHRLRLHAIVEPNAIYLTEFDQGDIKLDYVKDKTLTFSNETTYYGCHWLGMETLIPVNDREFAYVYDEVVMSCEPGATATRKTPRTGTVTVED